MSNHQTDKPGCLHRIGGIYTSIAIILLTTIMFLVGFEASIAIFRSVRSTTVSSGCPNYVICPEDRVDLPYYHDQDWAEEFWSLSQPKQRFQPYTLWRTKTNDDGFRTFDEEGHRVTPNGQCDEGAYHIYMFGGSTMWGMGSPDWETIPAYLQNFYNETDQTVCIHNMGQLAFHSTQEVVELVNLIQLGNRPDMVIFYDGVNEFGNLIGTGKPWLPSASFDTRKLEEDVSPFVELISTTNTYYFLSKFFKSPNDAPPITPYSKEQGDQIIQDTVNTYIHNYQIVETLGEQFDFEFHFFWQPTILFNKPLTEIEEAIVKQDVPSIGPPYFDNNFEVIKTLYDEIEELADRLDNLSYLGYVYETTTDLLFYDLYHVTPQGNELIAQEMFDILKSNP